MTGPWMTLDTVSNGSQWNVTVTTLADSVSMRYVRFYVTDAGIDHYARIPELEIYGTAASPSPLSMALSVDRSSYSTGDTLTVSVQVDNPNSPRLADFYFGAILPGRKSVILFIDPQQTTKTVSLSDLASWSPMFPRVDLAVPFSVHKPEFFTHTWGGNEKPGAYTFFLAAVAPGGLADGTVDEGDVMHTSATTFSFTP